MGVLSFLKNLGAGGVGATAYREYSQGNYPRAAELFEKVLDLKSSNTNERYIYVYLGRCYAAMGKEESAAKAFAQSYALYEGEQFGAMDELEKKNYKLLIDSYALVLERLGKHSEAQDLLSRNNQ